MSQSRPRRLRGSSGTPCSAHPPVRAARASILPVRIRRDPRASSKLVPKHVGVLGSTYQREPSPRVATFSLDADRISRSHRGPSNFQFFAELCSSGHGGSRLARCRSAASQMSTRYAKSWNWSSTANLRCHREQEESACLLSIQGPFWEKPALSIVVDTRDHQQRHDPSLHDASWPTLARKIGVGRQTRQRGVCDWWRRGVFKITVSYHVARVVVRFSMSSYPPST